MSSLQCLNELLEDDDKFGFIIMDGNGTLYGTVTGNTRTVLHKFTVDLPKKHGRGGQSALRFSRLREEKRHNYVRKVAELATQYFIESDRPNVTGLVLAGSADFKTVLGNSGEARHWQWERCTLLHRAGPRSTQATTS